MSSHDTTATGLRTVQTPSTQQPGNAPVPSEIIRDLLRDKWIDSELHPSPEVHVVNDVTHPAQANMKGKDWVMVETGSIREKQHGHDYEHIDIETPIELDFHTMDSRQRLYNMVSEARRIIYKHHLVTKPWEVLYWDGFTEESDGLHKKWSGYASLRGSSRGVAWFYAAADDYIVPSQDPTNAELA